MITVSKIASAIQPSGSQFSLLISGILNPITFTGAQVSLATLAATGGTLDTGTCLLTALRPTAITSASVSADNSTVQELATYSVTFASPLPLSAGAIVTIVFPPSDYILDLTLLTSVQGFGIFGALTDLPFTVDNSQMSIKIEGGIQSYRQADIQGQVVISRVQNPLTTRLT